MTCWNFRIFETSSLSNSGKWASYGEAYMYIPYVVAYKNSADMTGLATLSPYLTGIKGAFWNIIHSMSVEYNGTTVCQLTPFLNLWCNYKNLQSWSVSDVAKYGATTNFIKDNVDSIRYVNAVAASQDGTGVTNNSIAWWGSTGADNIINLSSSANGVLQPTFNTGFLQRQLSIYKQSTVEGNTVSLANNIAAAAHIFTDNGGAAAARIYYTSFNAIIRLKDICDFFDKLPLVKGAYVKLTINVNSAQNDILMAAVAGPPANSTYDLTGRLPTILTGGTTPYMVASGRQFNPGQGVTAGTLSFASNVARATISGTSVNHQILQSCRLYVPLYICNPIYEEQYVSMNPTKEVVYRDIYQYTINNILNGNSANALITNGISVPKQLVVIPYYNSTSSFSALAGLSALNSPLTGVNLDPYTVLTNFNVQLSGTNVFQQNVSYGFEEFLNEASRSFSVNGGQTTGLCSGLLNQHEWEKAYRYYVVDLSRGYKADDMIPKSILVSFNNVSGTALDAYCFVEMEKKITISISSGQVVQV